MSDFVVSGIGSSLPERLRIGKRETAHTSEKKFLRFGQKLTTFLWTLHGFFMARGVTFVIMATEPKAFSYFSSEIHLPDSSRPGEQREGVFLYIQSLPYQLKNKVTVLYTSYELTREAMKTACTLALRLDAVIEIVAAEVVPYPMPLDRPPVPFRSFIRCFESTLNQYPVKTELRVFLCRDQLEFLKQVLRPDSPVIMGVKATWPTQDEKLVQSLRRAGYEVILAKRQ